MNVLSEILDAAKIIDYVRGLDFVTEINILGHSQGAFGRRYDGGILS